MSKRPLALVIDDQEMDRKILTFSMKKFDIDVLETSDPKVFLEWLKTKKPDLCFIDLQMDGRDMGFSLIKSIRSVMGNKPVLFVVSGKTDSAAIAHAIESGANDYLLKPLNLNLLASKVGRFVKNDSISDFEADFLPWDGEEVRAQAEFQGTMTEVDEFGVYLRSPNLISKGAAIRLEGPWIETITGRKDGVLVTVIRNSYEENEKMSQFYAEFDLMDEALLMCVRRWLASMGGVDRN